MGVEKHSKRSERLTGGELTLPDVFLLSFVDSGLNSPYDLISKAGISVGLTSPSLKRLEQAGLLKKRSGPRNRIDYSLTERGKEEFQAALQLGRNNYWRLGASPSFDSLSRAVFLLWVHFGKADADKCIEFGVAELQNEARMKKHEADRISRSIMEPYLFADLGKIGDYRAALYWYLKNISDAALFDAQAEMLKGMRQFVSEFPTRPHAQQQQ